jgi:hypothetical protein
MVKCHILCFSLVALLSRAVLVSTKNKTSTLTVNISDIEIILSKWQMVQSMKSFCSACSHSNAYSNIFSSLVSYSNDVASVVSRRRRPFARHVS